MPAQTYSPSTSRACADVVHDGLRRRREAGMRPAVSLKPATPLTDIQRLLGLVDRVLVMSVEPGFGGQPFMPEALPKIEALRAMADDMGEEIEIAVDGGIKPDTIGPAVAPPARRRSSPAAGSSTVPATCGQPSNLCAPPFQTHQRDPSDPVMAPLDAAAPNAPLPCGTGRGPNMGMGCQQVMALMFGPPCSGLQGAGSFCQ